MSPTCNRFLELWLTGFSQSQNPDFLITIGIICEKADVASDNPSHNFTVTR